MSKEPVVDMDFVGDGITKIKETVYVGDEKEKIVYYMLDGKRYKDLQAARAARERFRIVDRKSDAEMSKQEAVLPPAQPGTVPASPVPEE